MEDNLNHTVIPLSRIREIASILVHPETEKFELWKKESDTKVISKYTSRDLGAAIYALLSLVDTAQEIIDEYPEADCPFHNNYENASECLFLKMGGRHGKG